MAQPGAFDLDELFALAKLDLRKGDVSAALEKLKTVTANPKSPAGAFSVCGQLYLQLELWGRAAAMFEKCLELEPEALDERYFLGLTHFYSGRGQEALKLWDPLLQKQPSYVPALLYRAILRVQQGDAAAAKRDLETLMKATPVDSPYFKPAKDLMQHLETRPPGGTAGNAGEPVPPAFPPILPGNAYKN